VAAYLKARARGISRAVAARELPRELNPSSLVGVEWNALTYAGHTVWNVHRDRDSDRHYRGGSKRRPRAEWVIQRDTHPALISDQEAEYLLSKLDTSTVRNNRYRVGISWRPHGEQSESPVFALLSRCSRVDRDPLEIGITAMIEHDSGAAAGVARRGHLQERSALQLSHLVQIKQLDRRVGAGCGRADETVAGSRPRIGNGSTFGMIR
jgi:hypothetical protein